MLYYILLNYLHYPAPYFVSEPATVRLAIYRERHTGTRK